jgi:tellurite resistance-related uncharacterized protein
LKELPASVAAYKRTPTFTEDSVPKGLLKAHQTKAGTWGKIVVLEGHLAYKVLESGVQEERLSIDHFGVVEPEVLHEVRPEGTVKFYVEFYR